MALEADVPSGSEDERLVVSDNSDIDKDYLPPDNDESDIDIVCSGEDDSAELEQVTLTIDSTQSREGGPVAKRTKTKRKTWQWQKLDLQHASIPTNKFEKKRIR